MYRGNCVPKHEGQLIWKFILVFSNLPVCLQICWEQINNTDSSYMQKFDIPKQKQQQKKSLNRHYTNENKIEMYQA